ncbi:MAG: MBL fold metallo-hydrolase [Oligoflexia bacterium]|nr:MBL fold metallo-hydrolase [Oligoflexia bacterium]
MSGKYFEQNLVVGPFQCNCRLLICPRTGEALLVDPGDDAERILQMLDHAKTATNKPVRVRYLLQTHGHLDHVGAARPVKHALKANAPQIALHRADEPLYLALKQQGALFGMEYEEPFPIDHYLEDGEDLRVGDLRFSVIHTPGHSPGSVCFRLHEDSKLGIAESLFSGDTLFQGSVGRTDLWGADGDQMFRSIRERILTLDDDTRVCPGHGPETRIGIEKRSNPFLQ